MCGLCGFARHPDAPQHDTLSLLLSDLLARMENRGKHATGVALAQRHNGDGFQTEIAKWAAPATTVVRSDAYRTAVEDKITHQTIIALGHVRYSTHPQNTHLAEAAHPFRIGKIVGAHNGIIDNWRDVERKLKADPALIVDSQAAFLALDRIKEPAKALDLLDGYWALTWIKGKSLFMCRTNSAPLACAYVPAWRTLLWHSEIRVLEAVLREAGLKLTTADTPGDFESWEIRPNTIYRYVPSNFTEKGTNSEKRDAAFRGRADGARWAGQNAAHPTWNGTTTVRSTSAGPGLPKDKRYGGNWDWNLARERDVFVDSQKEREKMDRKEVSLIDMKNMVSELLARVKRLEPAVELLLEVARDADWINQADEDALQGDGEAPNATTTEMHDPRQLGLRLTLCSECGRPGDRERGGVLVDDGHGGLIHARCIFADSVPVS
jgi:predicted glutamine amidotransferase